MPPDVGPFAGMVEVRVGPSYENNLLVVPDLRPTVATNPNPNRSPRGALQTILVSDDHRFDSQAEPAA